MPGARDGLKREGNVLDSQPHPPLRAIVSDTLTLFEVPNAVGSAAAAPPPPPVAAKAADVPNTDSAEANAAKIRSTYTALMDRMDDMKHGMDDMKMGLHDLKDDLCDFYHEYVEAYEEQSPLPVETGVSARSSSAGSLVQTALPQEAPPAVQAAPAAVQEARAVQEAPRSRSRHGHRKKKQYDEGGHVDLLSPMMSLPAAPHNSQLKNAWL